LISVEMRLSGDSDSRTLYKELASMFLRHLAKIALVLLLVRESGGERGSFLFAFAGRGEARLSWRIQETRTPSDTIRAASKDPQLAEPTVTQYLMEDWKSVEGLPVDQTRQIVKQTIADLWNARKITPKGANDLNLRWQREKDQLNRAALGDFFEKENQFREIRKSYAQAIRRDREFDNQIELLHNNIRGLEDDRRMWEFALQRNEEEYRSRLENISFSTCLIGRCRVPPEGPAEGLRELIVEEMIRAAISEVKGVDIFSAAQKDTLLVKYIARIEEGYALVSDNYFNLVSKVLGDDYFIYQILRLEVYPFKRSVRRQTVPTGERDPQLGKDIEIFKIVDNTSSKRFLRTDTGWRLAGSLEPLTIHQFISRQQQFIESQHQIVVSTNVRIESELEKFRDDYLRQKGDCEREIERIGQKIRDARRSLDSLAGQKKVNEREINQLLDAYETAYRKYTELANNKLSYVNKFAQVPNPGDPALKFTQNWADSSLRIRNELMRTHLSTKVLVEVGEPRGPTQGTFTRELRKIETREIAYHPQIVAFKILYFTMIQEVGDNPDLMLNIAFKIRWRKAEAFLKVSADSIIDRKQNLVWKMPSKEVTSRNYAQEKVPEGYRLPTASELATLCDLMAEDNESSDQNILDELGWSSDYPVISEELAKNENDEFVCQAFSLSDGKRLTLFPESTAYVLMVRNHIVRDE